MKKAEVLKAIAQKRKRYPKGHPKGGQFAPESKSLDPLTRVKVAFFDQYFGEGKGEEANMLLESVLSKFSEDDLLNEAEDAPVALAVEKAFRDAGYPKTKDAGWFLVKLHRDPVKTTHRFGIPQRVMPIGQRITPVVDKPQNGDMKEWGKRLSAFDDSPGNVKERVAEIGHPDIISPDGYSTSYFSSTEGIHMRKPFNRETYQHEYGHFLDYEFGGSPSVCWSRTGKFDEAFQEETLYDFRKNGPNFRVWKMGWEKSKHYQRYQEAQEAVRAKYRKPGVTELGVEVQASQRLGQLGDIISAMSGGYFEEGHTPEYFAALDGSRRNSEIFAQFFAFYSDPDLRDVPRRIAPKMWSVFIQKMKEEGFE